MMKRVARALAVVGAGLPIVLRDAVGLAAVGLISYGAWMVTPAAGFITGGVLLLAGVVLLSAKAG